MATKSQRDTIKALVFDVMVYLTGGDTTLPQVRETRYGAWLSAKLDVVDSETGAPDGTAYFSVFFQWDLPMCHYNVCFNGSRSHYLNRKQGLKMIIQERVDTGLAYALSCQPSCRAFIYEEVAA